ncbi:hypothetical protein PROFUN_10850 [Planoprotostelium fungivorum]|uniref:Calcineurin-like phosphoesterase domain-containing protein n=1 Tax=Planoprotostelium fungivorum TaxID=1890364 RepID=A0A2P6NCS6_9EUKA|nr:hypothetical protein PROFUN_10850 [Planoprotostelium fungivorum]
MTGLPAPHHHNPRLTLPALPSRIPKPPPSFRSFNTSDVVPDSPSRIPKPQSSRKHFENHTRGKIGPLEGQPYSVMIDGGVIAVGDVHGQTKKLKSLWRQLCKLSDFDEYTVVFLGDYVDRGPDSKGSLDFLLELQETRPKTYFLCGNHDLAFAAFLGLLVAPRNRSFLETWGEAKTKGALYSGPGHEDMHLMGRRWGGMGYNSNTTFTSYGVEVGDREALIKAVPESHQKFIKSLPWVIEHPDYLFIHAGLEENTHMSEQLRLLRQRDVMRPVPWLISKKPMVGPPDLTKIVVTGHVHVQDVVITAKKIQVDTTGGRVGQMSAIVLPSCKVIKSNV